MFTNLRKVSIISRRTLKNFGHKREPVPLFTTLWHGFLTVTFIGCGLEWNRFKTFFFGEGDDSMIENTEEKDNV